MNDPNEFFTGFPDRPDAPEFWKLSDVVLRNDARCSESEEGFEEVITEVIPIEVLTYMAEQRAMRVIHPLAVLIDPELFISLTAMFMDGFLIGANYAKEAGK